ncbi:DUF2612 domain-containing protein [Cupriavidus sp. D384]|uniref:DUF2612 domain-containing protein n=1 Tax=Cupriavidus sp. D384 TaxID=1538095 RepID=UPI000835F02C|nr:DUF2612 domain-containing protein [Cupriavidus sp. D384]
MDLRQRHDEVAWDNWLGQFHGKPKLEALVCGLLAPANLLQAALLQLHTERWLDVAVGTQLDMIGTVVVLDRSGSLLPQRWAASDPARMNDDSYRSQLRWKIAINNGHGTIPEISAALKAVLGATRAVVQNAGNAKLRIWLDILPSQSPFAPGTVRLLVPKAAGVGIRSMAGGGSKPFGFRHQRCYGFGVGFLSRNL